MCVQHATGELAHDQVFELINLLDLTTIKHLCSTNRYYRTICRDNRFTDLIQRKYREYRKRREKGINEFENILKTIRGPTTINYYLESKHSLHFYVKIRTNRTTGMRSIYIDDLIEQAEDKSIDKYILAQLFNRETGMTLDSLLKMSQDELIDLIGTEEEFESAKDPLDYYLEQHNFKIFKQRNNLEIIFYEPSDEQIQFIIRTIYDQDYDPKITLT